MLLEALLGNNLGTSGLSQGFRLRNAEKCFQSSLRCVLRRKGLTYFEIWVLCRLYLRSTNVCAPPLHFLGVLNYGSEIKR